MKLTANFSLSEFTASDTAKAQGIDNTPSVAEVNRLHFCAVQMEVIRVLCGNRPIEITSGFRSEKLNRAVGGSNSSDHRNAYAVDFRVTGLSDLLIARIIQASDLRYDQIIRYGNGRLHIGFGPNFRFQKLIKAKNGYTSTTNF